MLLSIKLPNKIFFPALIYLCLCNSELFQSCIIISHLTMTACITKLVVNNYCHKIFYVSYYKNLKVPISRRTMNRGAVEHLVFDACELGHGSLYPFLPRQITASSRPLCLRI